LQPATGPAVRDIWADNLGWEQSADVSKTIGCRAFLGSGVKNFREGITEYVFSERQPMAKTLLKTGRNPGRARWYNDCFSSKDIRAFLEIVHGE
jgi:hypothetical protein